MKCAIGLCGIITLSVCSLALAQADSELRESGVSIRIFEFEEDIEQLPDLVSGQTPNFAFKRDRVELTDPESFGGDVENKFLTEISGFINVRESGTYTFRLASDDGSILNINNSRVVSNDGLHDADEPKEGRITLSPGEHKFLIRHFDMWAGEVVILQWKPPGATEFAVVPNDVFTTPAGEVRVTSPGKKKIIAEIGAPRRPGDGVPLVDVHPGFDLFNIRPLGFEPKVGGVDFLPDGRMILCTWDPNGAVYILDGVEGSDPAKIIVKRFAAGLAEPLGIKVVDGRIYVLQKQELTELVDTDKDDIADTYRCIAADWNVTDNFHEFAFGLVHKDGHFYANLAIAIDPGGRTSKPQARGRGTILKISPDGYSETFATGIRTPNGIGLGPEGEIFVSDNQGDWLPSSKLIHVQQGRFYGNHISPDHANGTIEPTPPVVWLPQNEIGNSPSQPVYVKAGPYAGQMLVGDVTHGGLNRVFIEKINGQFQGAVFQFTQGLEAGVNRVVYGPDGALYVGGIGSGGNWGQTGKKGFGLQRLTFNGKTAFEPLAVRAMSNGIEIEFTEALAPGIGDEPSDYFVQQYHYEPTDTYGGSKLGLETIDVASVGVSQDRKRVFVPVDSLKPDHMIYLRMGKNLKSASGNSLWITEAWYTLNSIPSDRKGIAPPAKPLNVLTDAERLQGWRLLFDGQSTDMWRGYRREEMPSGWKAVNGALTRVDGGGDVVTKEKFGNFEFAFEWKVEPRGNSGVYYRASEELGSGYLTGPEMQVLDDTRHVDGKNPITSAGSAYAIVAPSMDVSKPAGMWNQSRIVCDGNHVEHWLNGTKILTYEINSPEWKTAVAKSKFASELRYGQESAGHIVLQDHGDTVAYRNLKLRPLP